MWRLSALVQRLSGQKSVFNQMLNKIYEYGVSTTMVTLVSDKDAKFAKFLPGGFHKDALGADHESIVLEPIVLAPVAPKATPPKKGDHRSEPK